MRAFSAIAIVVLPFVIGFSHGYMKKAPRFLNLIADFWQIGNS